MEILTVIFFLVYTWGFGYAVSPFDKNDDPYEKNIIRLGFGISVSAFLFALFSLIRIPIDWRLFLILSLIAPIIYLIRTKGSSLKSLKFKVPSLNIILLLIIFCASLYFYTTGAFAYPYLEDDDPWAHAIGARYVAEEKTAYEPDTVHNYLFYMDARPPAYDSTMGMLLQVSARLSEVLKFFNSLFICLGLLFFYFFFRQISKSSNKALFATAVLAMIPAYFTHFIWAQSLAIALFFPALYCFNKIEENRLWLIPASFSIAGILLTQETKSIKFAIIIAGYFAIKCIVNKKINIYQLLAPVAGLFLSLFWWLPMILRYGGLKATYRWGIEGIPLDYIETVKPFIHPSIKKVYYGVLGSATRQQGVYTFSDFFTIGAKANMINVSIGIGFVAMTVAIVGLICLLMKLKKDNPQKKEYILFMLFFLLFTFLGVNGGMHWWSPVALFSFRFWLLFAVAVAMLSAEGMEFLKAFAPHKYLKFALVIVLLIGVFYSAGDFKIKQNTMQWPPGGGWISEDELRGYVSLSSLPPDTKVFPLTGPSPIWAAERIAGFDQFYCIWCKDEQEFGNWTDKSPDELNVFLKRNSYSYALIDSHVSEFGEEKAKESIGTIMNSTGFRPVSSNSGFILLKVV